MRLSNDWKRRSQLCEHDFLHRPPLLLLGRLVKYGIEVARVQGNESLVIAVEGQILQGM
jgi:hypothetical protein